MDQIRLITSHDGEAYLAKTMLDTGTDYTELLRAGFSASIATQLLAAYYSVPSGAQATRTAALADFAVIRSMTQSDLISFFTWADADGITLPLDELRNAAGRPTYSETDTQAISAYVSALA
jgi:hypothetical protein